MFVRLQKKDGVIYWKGRTQAFKGTKCCKIRERVLCLLRPALFHGGRESQFCKI